MVHVDVAGKVFSLPGYKIVKNLTNAKYRVRYHLKHNLGCEQSGDSDGLRSLVFIYFSLVADLGSAVAMLAGAGNIQGVVRLLQLSEEACLIDGTIDGLDPGPHGLHIHTLGDLTQHCLRWE